VQDIVMFIASRQVFAVYGAILIFSLATGLWLFNDLKSSRDQIVQDEAALSIERSRFLAQAVGRDIDAVKISLRHILDRVQADELVFPDPDPAHHQQVSNMLDEEAAHLPNISILSLAVFDQSCMYSATMKGGISGRRSNHPICTMDKVEPGRFYIQYLPIDKSLSKEPVLLIVYPLVTPDGKLAGGATAILRLFGAQHIIDLVDHKPTEFLALLDQNETVLARRPATFGPIGSVFNNLYAHTPFEASGRSSLVSAVSSDHKRYLLALSPVQDTPLTMVAGIDRDGILLEWWRRAIQLAITFAIEVTLTLLIANTYIQMWKQRDEMSRLATTDALTGVANRRRFMQVLDQMLKRAQIEGNSFTLLMIDIDHFKVINDTFGHPTGDKVISALAQTLMTHVRPGDLVGRIGGEEFAVILPYIAKEHAEMVAERLREAVDNISSITDNRGGALRFQISVGLAELTPCDADADALLARADRALYAAKESGRNRVVSAPSLQPDMSDRLSASVDNWTI
jgi:diguanylate cyclase (GGDEF)-like protein